MKHTLAELSGGAPAILEAFLRHPQGKVTRNPNIAMTICRAIVEANVVAAASALIEPAIREAYELHVLAAGERADAENRDDWDGAIDDAVEAIIEPYSHLATAGWMGTHVIDTRLYEPGGIDDLCKSFGQEAWRVLCHDSSEDDPEKQKLSTNKILSACGIVRSDIEVLLNEQPPVTAEQEKQYTMSTLNQTLNKLHAHCGGAFDPGVYEGLFENAVDDDDGIALSGASQMGGDMDDVEVLRMFAMTHEGNAAEALCDMLADAPYPDDGEATASPSPALSAATAGQPTTAAQSAAAAPQVETGVAVEKPKRGRGKAAADVEGAIPAAALEAIRLHLNIKDEDLGAGLGVSRQTFINYAKGKSAFVPNTDQRVFLLGKLDEATTALQEARDAIGEAR